MNKSLNDLKQVTEIILRMETEQSEIRMENLIFKNKINIMMDENEDDTTTFDKENEPNLDLDKNYVPDDVDLSDISTAVNCGISLDLKDFSRQFIEENESNDGTLKHVIKKSSLCWLLEKHRERVSSDRLRRFINLNNKTNDQEKTPKKLITPVSSENELLSESDSTPLESPYESGQSDDEENPASEITLKIEKYYAVRYDINWYIGRLLSIKKNVCEFKFHQADLDVFKWPRSVDIQDVNKKYIFYGPVNFNGIGPFSIKRFERK